MTTVSRLDDPSVIDAEEVLAALGTDVDQGLTAVEVGNRLTTVGANELRSGTTIPTWRKVLQQFRDPLIYLLFGAIVISLAAWVLEGADGWPYDAIVIAVLVVINAVLGYTQEARAEQAVDALRRMSATTATVLRDGSRERVPTRENRRPSGVHRRRSDTAAARDRRGWADARRGRDRHRGDRHGYGVPLL